jgi:hypothetical protein
MKTALVVLLIILLWAITAVIVLGVTGGFDSETAPTSTPTVSPTISPTTTPTPPLTPTYEPGVIYVTAEKLCDDYNSNEIAADAKYKGNILEVSSTVESLGRDFLSNDKAYLRMNCGWIMKVFCYFDEAYESQLVPVHEGDLVSVRGECMGINIIKRVILNHCTSVEFLISE